MKYSFNKFLKIPLALILAFAIYTSCTKEYLRAPILLLPEDAHSYFLFNSGSYWIFQDSVSGDFDTLFCDFSQDDTVSNMETNLFFETAYSHFKNKGWNLGDYISNSVDTYKKDRDSVFASILSGFTVRFPIRTGNISSHLYCSNCDDISHIDTVLNSYTFNSMNFGKTIVISVSNDFNTSGLTTKYFFSDGIGLIKYSRNGNYKLVSYHLE